jgi:hypothetical protein
MAGTAKKKDFNAAHGVTNTNVKHLVSDTLIQSVMYPAHEPRKTSGIYRKTHQLLIYKDDTPCWICGVKESNLKADGPSEVTAANPLGAKQMETHHNIIEWAAANAIDWDKVAKDYPDMKTIEHVAHAWDLENGTGHPKYGRIKHIGMSKKYEGIPKYKEIDSTEFVDGVEQMKVLCDVHHRNPYYGIHAITGPIWQLQRYSMNGFEFIPKDLKDGVKKSRKGKTVGRPPG